MHMHGCTHDNFPYNSNFKKPGTYLDCLNNNDMVHMSVYVYVTITPLIIFCAKLLHVVLL